MLHLDRLLIRQGGFTLRADATACAGERIAVIGPSGGGKSTLLMAIAGFLAPAEGRILWQGRDLGPLGPGERPVSLLFQDQNLFPHLTLRENLGLGISPALRLAAGDRARIAEALERVGLAGLGEAKPGRLSGGQQGRAALARALLRARPILLLDEPFAALGPALKAEMLALVSEIAAETGATVLMVTHDPEDARRFAHRTILVADGRAEAPQPTAALFADPPPALRAYLGP
ncbi:ATP-binding cassette domain-containing protein [Cereibacter sphaeroides]|uniref:thiamine ABC transporter ATP-binding protein n=1 Tax=Cereibacter sphaeroides TaxID=1063 RepID=UPI000F537F66|nr:ATP-binding cassette domain-containing protein [Cereibacter sphaeroides]AZB53792.1 ATP-binding cassette domain-containing protein [Cereibacter sphaeroides]AZB58051.1 ATP-binding cassette domain-containing protein [Cereibacter sphaeroides]